MSTLYTKHLKIKNIYFLFVLLYSMMNLQAIYAGDTLSVQGPRFLLDGQPFDMWGVRVVNSLWNETQTQEILAAMPDYIAHGINTVCVSLQGGYPGYEREPNGQWYSNSAFNPDGSLKADYMDRLRRILERASELDMVVNVQYFYQRQCRKAAETVGLDEDHFESDDAIYEATRNATEWLLPYRHVFLDIANEFGHAGYQYDNVFPDPNVVGWSEYISKAQMLVDEVHSVDPDRLCGLSICSGQDPLDIPGAEIAYHHGLPREHTSDDKPQVNNEQLFRGSYGVYDEPTKAQIMEEAQTEHDNGNFWFWASGWHQFSPFNFHLGGYGTAADPGDHWIYDYIAEITSQINITLIEPQQSSFDLLETVYYQAEAFDCNGYPILDDMAYEWYYDKVGGIQDAFIGSGQSGSTSFSSAGIYQLRVIVSYDGQSKEKSKTLHIGQVPGEPVALNVSGRFPSITVDDAGRAHLVYVNGFGVYYMLFDQNGWGAPELIPESDGVFSTRRKLLDIATDSEGNAHVVWLKNETVQYVNRTNGVWSSPQEILDRESKGFAIAADSDDNIWVVYRAYYGTTEAVFCKKKLAGEELFGDYSIVYFDGSDRDHAYPDIAAGDDGFVHFAWRWDDYDDSSFDPFYRKYKAGAWYDTETVDNSEKKINDGLAIAIHPDGTPRIVYYDGKVRVAKPEWGYWTRQTTGFEWSSTLGEHFAVIAVDATGRMYIVTHLGGDKNSITETDSVFYRIYDPYSGWEKIHHIDPQIDIATGQPAVASGDSCAHVVWMDINENLYHRILGDVPTLSNNSPVAVISATPTSGVVDLRVEFDGTGSYDPDGEIVSYYWEFGDGDTSHQVNPTHIYSEPVGFEPRLYVTDNAGESSMSFVYIEAHEFTSHISCSGNDLVLSWNEESEIEHYNIFRGTTPYFEPETTIAVVTESEYIDVGMGTGSSQNYYYIVEAVRSAPNDPIYRRLAKMIQPLGYGYNLISLPVIPANTSLADVLGEALTGGNNSLDADRIMKWNGSGYDLAWLVGGTGTELDGTWLNEDGSAVTDLTIGPDEGFWVDIRPAHPQVDLLILGQISNDEYRNINTQSGMNLVGFTYPVPMTLEESNINSAITGATNSVDADRIMVWTGNGYEIAWLLDDGVNCLWMNEAGTDTSDIILEPFLGFWLHIRDGNPGAEWCIPNPNGGN